MHSGVESEVAFWGRFYGECWVGFYGCILGYILSCILVVESVVAFWG